MLKDNTVKKTMFLTMMTGVLMVTILLFSFAIFYPNKGYNSSIDNTLTTGIFSFTYLESNRGINITNAVPKTDAEGKSQLGQNETFDFTLNAVTDGKNPINYTITVAKNQTSTLQEDWVKVYLSKLVNDKDVELNSKISTFNELNSYNNRQYEKELYKSTVSIKNYTEKYRFRMWIKDNADSTNANFIDKTFKVKINVYAN